MPGLPRGILAVLLPFGFILLIAFAWQWRIAHHFQIRTKIAIVALGMAGRREQVWSSAAASNSSCPRLLLIVIFNNNFYKNIPFLRQLYGQAFQGRMVYYGPVADSTYNVIECTGFHRGFLQHRCVAMAMNRSPDYDGYVWIGDDAVLNVPRLLLSTDLSKVWTMRLDQGWPLGPRVRIFGPIPAKPNWYWRNPEIGMSQVWKAYTKLPDKYKKRMVSAFGMEASVVTAWSDAGYIPGKYSGAFQELVGGMKDVTFECAFPTMVRLMCDNVSKEVVEFDGVYLAQFQKTWPITSPILHPVKFSAEKNRQTVLEWLGMGFTFYDKELARRSKDALPANKACRNQIAQPSPMT